MRFLFLFLIAIEHMVWAMVALLYGYSIVFVATMAVALVILGLLLREIRLNLADKGRHAV